MLKKSRLTGEHLKTIDTPRSRLTWEIVKITAICRPPRNEMKGKNSDNNEDYNCADSLTDFTSVKLYKKK